MIQCPVCDTRSDSFRTITSECSIPAFCAGETLVRHKCTGCDAIFGTQEMLNMTNKQESEFNKRAYVNRDPRVRETNNLRHVELFGRLGLPRGAKVLNWGGGPSIRLAEEVEEKFGFEFSNFEPYLPKDYPSIKSLSELKTYDAIVTTDVLEHLTKPIESLLEMKKFLVPSGIMVHHTPCYRYEYAYTKLHVCFYLGRSTRILAKRIGMSVKFIDRNTAVFR